MYHKSYIKLVYVHYMIHYVTVSLNGEATVCKTVLCGFDSHPSLQYAPVSALSIMDNTGDFYSLNVGSIPAGRTILHI